MKSTQVRYKGKAPKQDGTRLAMNLSNPGVIPAQAGIPSASSCRARPWVSRLREDDNREAGNSLCIVAELRGWSGGGKDFRGSGAPTLSILHSSLPQPRSPGRLQGDISLGKLVLQDMPERNLLLEAYAVRR